MFAMKEDGTNMGRKFTQYPNGKELITVNDYGNTCALYQESYDYGGDTALFLYDLTNDENWGDITINLPGYSGMFLQDFISDDLIKELSGVFTVLGEFPYNYGTYKMISLKPGMLNKIPTWDELCEMVQS